MGKLKGGLAAWVKKNGRPKLKNMRGSSGKKGKGGKRK